ncbi:MAG: AHH domain-containing protein [Bifidobacteriaceae bacterium]|nr:AHH domain-containing protein [Bifidobacteriaceae bacterium]
MAHQAGRQAAELATRATRATRSALDNLGATTRQILNRAKTTIKGEEGFLAPFAQGPSGRVLGRHLRAAGTARPPGAAAHHIVAGRHPNAQEGRDVLDRFGIDINDAGNGVFLPRFKSSPNPTGAAVHSTLHTNRYFDAVDSLISKAGSRQEALSALGQIRAGLLAGRFP